MKTYQQLTDYLGEENCSEDPDTIVPAVGDIPKSSFYRNCINGETCQIFDEGHSVNACCHVFYELKIDPMPEMLEDYHLYCSFREYANSHPTMMEDQNRNPE